MFIYKILTMCAIYPRIIIQREGVANEQNDFA